MTAEDPREELLVVFVKYPEPGRVKTRLAVGIGERAAADAYRELVVATLVSVREWLQADLKNPGPSVVRAVWIYFDPQEREDAVQAWLAPSVGEWAQSPQWVVQPSGDLGKRLQWVFHQGFKSGFSSICAIGTDCPELAGSGLERAFELLRQGEGVVGPTTDGGYYLIGLKRECTNLFINIPWSSARTLEVTREAAQTAGMALTELPVLTDIDTEAEWRRWGRKNVGR